MPPQDPVAVLNALAGARPGRLQHAFMLPGRTGTTVPPPEWIHPLLLASLRQSGTMGDRVWGHQRTGAELVRAGRDVVVATGAGSGKSLVYLLPSLTAILEARDAGVGGPTLLYLAPTKALGADQLQKVLAWDLPGIRAASYDGDTEAEERRWVRRHANTVFTNPDLLHHGILPNHPSWASFLRRLRYVVVDECHMYHGVFGSQVSAVLRRLRRVCRLYHVDPTFVLASATVADPGELAGALTGRPVEVVTEDGSPHGSLLVGLWDGIASTGPPGVVDSAAGPVAARGSSVLEEATALLLDLVRAEVQTVVFARSRAGVETVVARARQVLHDTRTPGVDVPDVVGYRGGYLPEERRAVEDGLRKGRVRGVVATNALELGVDLPGLRAVVMAGWPGSRASLRQQAGRVGRRGDPALAILVAGPDPLERYLLRHPGAVFALPLEATVVETDNPRILTPHLAAAAAEIPLTAGDDDYLPARWRDGARSLETAGLLRRRPNGWYWTLPESPSQHFGLRGVGTPVRLVEVATGRLLGTVDADRALTAVHPGAVYLHQGEVFRVEDLDLDQACALVAAGDPGYRTQARTSRSFTTNEILAERSDGGASVRFGEVTVITQVTSYCQRAPDGRVLGQKTLRLPARSIQTRGAWWSPTPAALADSGVPDRDLPGALHAAEHAAISLLPLVATIDRGDVAGARRGPTNATATVLVYDVQTGGAGFSQRAYGRWPVWLRSCRDAIAHCDCSDGCPACIHSPSCGSGNTPLDKAAAIALLDAILRNSSAADAPA